MGDPFMFLTNGNGVYFWDYEKEDGLRRVIKGLNENEEANHEEHKEG